MRPVLLVLGILLGIIGGAIAILPRLVDDQAIERHLVASIEAAVGRPIVIRGPVDLQLWPRPRLTLRKIGLERREVGDEALGVEIEQLEIGLGIAGLLRGEVRVNEAKIVRPRIELAGDADEIQRLDAAIASLARLDPGVATISVADALITWHHGRAGEPILISGLDVELVSGEKTNTIGVGGRGRLGEDDFQVEIETRRTSHAAPVKLVLVVGQGPSATRLGYRGLSSAEGFLDGTLELAGTSERIRDQLAQMGYLEPAGLAAPDLAFALKGKLELHAAGLELTDLRIATSGGELEGRVDWQSGAAPGLTIALEAAKITLAEQPLDRHHLALLFEPWAGGLEARLSLKVGTLARGAEQLRLLRLEAHARASGEIAIERLTADLPGTGDIAVTAELAPDAGQSVWRGRLEGAVQETGRLRRWLGLGDDLAWLDDRQGLALTTGFRVGPMELTLDGAEFRLDAMRATGRLAYIRSLRPRLELAGKVERLVLDQLRQTPRARLAQLQEQLERDDLTVEVDLELQRVAWNELRLEGVRLDAKADAERLELRQLVAIENGGARLEVTGVLPWNQGPVDLELEAVGGSLGRLARLWPVSLPLTLPAEGRATLQARLRGTAEGAAIDASLTAPQVEVRLSGRVALEDTVVPLDVAAEVVVPSLAGLGPALTFGTKRPDALQATLRAKRQSRASYDVGADLTLAEGRHQVALTVTSSAPRPKVEGKIRLEPLGLQALGQVYRALEAPLGLIPGPLATWPGNWPATILALDSWSARDVDLEVEAALENGDVALGPARLHLAIQNGRLQLDRLDLPVAGGRLEGEIVVDPSFGVPVVGLTLRVGRLDSAALARDALGAATAGLLALPVMEPVDLTLVADSVGSSIREILANLEGRIESRGLAEPWPLRRGVLAIQPRLRWELDGREYELGGFLDPAAWMMELDLTRPTADGSERLRLLGTLDRPRRIEATAEAAPR